MFHKRKRLLGGGVCEITNPTTEEQFTELVRLYLRYAGPDGYTLRCAFEAAVAASDLRLASAQSSSVIEVNPANVPGPASI